MKIAFIIIISLLFICLVIVMVISKIIYNYIFKRQNAKKLVDIDLTNTHYEAHIDKVNKCFAYYENKEKKQITIKSFDNLSLKALATFTES